MAQPRKSPKPKKAAQAVEQADRSAARHAGQWRDHRIVKVLGWLSEGADQPPLYALSAGTAALGLLTGNKRLARTGVRMFAAQWLATKAKTFVKRRVDRTRPHVPANGGRYRMEQGHSHDKALNSFPSGHTAGAVAVARAYASEYPEHAGRAAALAVFAGAMQVPRSMHFPTDVGAGAAIGLAAGSLVAKRRSADTTETR